VFQSVPAITLRSSLKSLKFRLWDESGRKLVGFKRMRQLRRAARGGKHPG
jgi:acyl-lipid omega-6 desaturase (Delta-12 desaturase)